MKPTLPRGAPETRKLPNPHSCCLYDRGVIEILPEPGTADTWLLPIKAIPGARRDAIVGPYGDRLKVRVSAPPEGGNANKAICGLIAKALGVRRSAVTIASGPACPEKTLRIEGAAEDAIRAMIDR